MWNSLGLPKYQASVGMPGLAPGCLEDYSLRQRAVLSAIFCGCGTNKHCVKTPNTEARLGGTDLDS